MKAIKSFSKLPKKCDQLPDNARVISFSQWEIYAKCPHRWFLSYPLKLKDKTPNINLFFGNVVHEVIQTYEAGEINKNMVDEFYHITFFNTLDTMLKSNNNIMFTTEDELEEFYKGGSRILKEYIKSITPNLNTFVGCEVPLVLPIVNNVYFLGFIDKVERQNSKFKFIDYKTSNSGWGRYQLEDEVKHSQITLYKYFMSVVYDIPIDKITGEYIVLVRMPEDKDRIQYFKPKQSSTICQTQYQSLTAFIEKSFNKDGSYNMDAEHKAVRGMNFSNCKFCEFNDNNDLCPTKKRLISNIEDDKDSFQLY